MADFLGFWMVENRATVSRAASLYPELRQKKSRPKAARQLKSSLSSRSYPAEPGIHSLVANRIALGVVRRAGFR